jgi:hypothetical protein
MIYWTSNLLERHAAERVSLSTEIPMETTNHLVTTPATTGKLLLPRGRSRLRRLA